MLGRNNGKNRKENSDAYSGAWILQKKKFSSELRRDLGFQRIYSNTFTAFSFFFKLSFSENAVVFPYKVNSYKGRTLRVHSFSAFGISSPNLNWLWIIVFFFFLNFASTKKWTAQPEEEKDLLIVIKRGQKKPDSDFIISIAQALGRKFTRNQFAVLGPI